MKILFINGSLEPAKDGVGDYVRGLADALSEGGWEVCLVSIHDPWIESFEEEDVKGVRGFRMPTSASWQERKDKLRKVISDFKPDWISLQFVPYSFNAHGLNYRLLSVLPKVLAESKARCHWMFHELWIGATLGSSLKDRILGCLQRYFLLKLYRELAPEVTHTSIEIYRHLLQLQGIDSSILPLWGNIPLKDDFSLDYLDKRFEAFGMEGFAEKRAGFMTIGVFGSIYLKEGYRALFERLITFANKENRKLIVLAMGRRRVGEDVWSDLVSRYNNAICFADFGFMESGDISLVMNGLDYGLATTPWEGIEKSGTAISFLEHGIPIIGLRGRSLLKGDTFEPMSVSYIIADDAHMESRLSGNLRPKRGSRLNTSCDTFMKALSF